jgi:hypothetical protein
MYLDIGILLLLCERYVETRGRIYSSQSMSFVWVSGSLELGWYCNFKDLQPAFRACIVPHISSDNVLYYNVAYGGLGQIRVHQSIPGLGYQQRHMSFCNIFPG